MPNSTFFNEISKLVKNHLFFGSEKQLQSTLPEHEYDFVIGARSKANIERLILFSLVMFFFEIINISVLLITKAGLPFTPKYICVGLFLIALSIAFLIIGGISLVKKASVAACKIYYRGFLALFAVGTLIFAFLEYSEKASVNNFIMFICFISIIPVLTAKESFFFIGLPTLAEFALISTASKNFADPFALALMVGAGGFFISSILYSNYMSVKLSQNSSEKLAETDPLTNLLNRRGMEKRLQSVIACSKENCSIMLAVLDIDFFKDYNDAFGHPAGDECLISISRAIESGFKRSTDIVARFGGEEFIIFALRTKDDQAVTFLTELLKNIECLSIPAGNTKVHEHVTVSIGAATSDVNSYSSFKELFDKADKELLHAKQNGKNCLSIGGNIYRSVQ